LSLIHGMSITDQMTADNVGQNTGYVEEDSGFVLHLRLTSTRRIEKFHKSPYVIFSKLLISMIEFLKDIEPYPEKSSKSATSHISRSVPNG
jgi:hypothetical protein